MVYGRRWGGADGGTSKGGRPFAGQAFIEFANKESVELALLKDGKAFTGVSDASAVNFKQRRKEQRANKFKNSKWCVNVSRVLADGKRKEKAPKDTNGCVKLATMFASTHDALFHS